MKTKIMIGTLMLLGLVGAVGISRDNTVFQYEYQELSKGAIQVINGQGHAANTANPGQGLN